MEKEIMSKTNDTSRPATLEDHHPPCGPFRGLQAGAASAEDEDRLL
jgi:hypothetical protein